MAEIIPSILTQSYEDMKNKVAQVRGISPIVQVDICDGVFVKSLTWPFFAPATKGAALSESGLDEHFKRILNEQEGMPFWEDIDYELDLLVSDAVQNFDIYTKLGPKKIIFHIEAVGNLTSFKDFLEGIDMYVRESLEIGVAINPSTPTDDLFSLISCVDFVQCMGNDKIGYQGISLDSQVYEKVRILRKKYPDLPIAVDIGVNQETAPRLVEAGATKLVIGSAIFETEDIIGTIEEFRNL